MKSGLRKRDAYIKGIINQILGNAREHIQARQREIHVVTNVALQNHVQAGHWDYYEGKYHTPNKA